MTELWVRMQEEGYVPSDAVKSKMAEAFQQEGKPAPFQVPIQGETTSNPFVQRFWKFITSIQFLLRHTHLFNRFLIDLSDYL